jgi:MYXO-CTERM domain-containing protein
VTDSGEEGCVCPEGFVARQVVEQTRFNPVATVNCQDPLEDLIGTPDQIGDPCEGFSCGDFGTCVPVNGFPSCDCDAGYTAIADPSRPAGVTCRETMETFTTARLSEEIVIGDPPADSAAAWEHASCMSASTSRPTEFLMLGALLLMFALRRRRK